MSESFAEFYKLHSQFLDEIFAKTMSEEDVILEGKLQYLLFEGELDQPDVEALRAQTKSLRQFVQKIATGGVLPKSAEMWMKDQLDNLDAADNFVIKLDLGNPKGALDRVKSIFGKGFTVANGVAVVALIDQQVSGGLAAMGEATALIYRNLDGKLDDKTKLIDIPESSEITKEDIAGGIKKAFDKSMQNKFSQRSTQFTKKVGGAAAKIPGVIIEPFPVDVVMPELMQLTLPQLEAISKAMPPADIPPNPGSATSDAMKGNFAEPTEEEASIELDSGLIGKAGQAWLNKLKSDGADESMLKIGKAWIAAVTQDPDFKKVAGLQESYKTSLSFLLYEQVKWPDLVAVFSKNKPKAFAGLPDETIEPLIAPFAQGLADQGVEVVDKNGNPFKPPVADTDEAIEDVEEDSPPDDKDSSKLSALAKGLSKIPGIIDPEKAASKINKLFDFTGTQEEEAVVEEGHAWSLYDLLTEKTAKYKDVVKALEDHLPAGESERIKVIRDLHGMISTEYGDSFGVADLPEPPVDSDEAELVKSLQDIKAQAELVPADIDVEDINQAAAEKIATDLKIDSQLATNLLDPAKDAAEDLKAIPAEVKEDPNWFEKFKSVALARMNGWIKKGLGVVTQAFENLEAEYGVGVVDAITAFVEKAQNSITKIPNELKAEFLEKIGQSSEDPAAGIEVLGVLFDESGLGEDELKELLPEKLANAILGAEEQTAEKEIEIGKAYNYTNSKGEEIFVKIVGENPQDDVWQVVSTTKDGEAWKKDTQDFAAKVENIGDEIEEDEIFGEKVSGQKIKTADFNSKIATAIDSVYGDDEELLDLISSERHDEKVPGVLAKVSQELFGDDFALEESLYRKKLFPFLFEGEYVWADVQKSIAKHAGEVPPDLLHAIFAQAVPEFEELGVTVRDVPEVDIATLKSSLSGDPEVEIDPNEELSLDPEELEDAGISEEEIAKMDADAKKLAGSIGSGPITKTTLAKILKSHPDIVGQGQKATRARRKLRKAINMAYGSEVFEEAFDYDWSEEDRYLLTESNEEDAISRWKKLAGIKE
jgi:hypothetical protein